MAEAALEAKPAGPSGQRVAPVAVALALSAALWWWSLGAGGGHHHHHQPPASLAAMWVLMMAAMMLPAEVPLLWRLPASTPGPLAAFLSGYLAVWSAFSVVGAGLQRALEGAGLLGHDLALRDPALAAAALGLGALSQLTPWKRRCLQKCHAPPASLVASGPARALVAGLRHGALSVGACGGLMLALFAVGAMNPLAMAGVTGWLLLEGLLPRCARADALGALGLVTGAAALLLA